MNGVTRDEIIALSERARVAGQTGIRDLLLMTVGMIDADGKVASLPPSLDDFDVDTDWPAAFFSDAMSPSGAWGKGLALAYAARNGIDNRSCKV